MAAESPKDTREAVPPSSGNGNGSSGDPDSRLDQSELDSLLASLTGTDTPPAEEPTGEEIPLAEDASGTAASREDVEFLTDEELDAILTSKGGDQQAGQGELDGVIGADVGNGAALGMESVLSADGSSDQSAIDALLAETAALSDEGIAPSSTVTVAGPTADQPPEPLASDEPSPSESAISQDVIDALLAAAKPEESPEELVVAPVSATPATAPGASETPPVPGDAPKTPQPESGKAPVTPKTQQDKGKTPATPSADVPKKRAGVILDARLLSLLGRAPRVNLAKAITSLAAGVLFAAGAFAMLYAHRAQVPDVKTLISLRGDGLRGAMETARTLMEQGRFSDAVDELKGALAKASLDPERSDAQFMQTEASYRALPKEIRGSDIGDVISEIDDLVGNNPSHPRAPEALFWKADVFERLGKPQTARQVYERIVKQFPSAPILDEVLMAAAHLAMKDRPSQAAEYLKVLVAQFPASPLAGEARVLLGEVLAAAGQPVEAKATLQQVVGANPNSGLGARATAGLCQQAIDKGQYEEAIAQAENWLKTSAGVENSDRLRLVLAKAYRGKQKPAEATRVLKELLASSPDSEMAPSALIQLSRVLAETGQQTEALRTADQAAKQFPGDSAVLRNNAELLASSGNDEGAAPMFLAAYEAGAKDPDLLLAAGRHFLKAGKLPEARKALETIVAENPRSPAAFEGSIELAKVAWGQGQPRQALQRLEDLATASLNKPQHLPIMVALGNMYEEMGIDSRTAEAYQRVAELTTEPEVLAKAAVGLLKAGAWNAGLAAANRVDLGKVKSVTAYSLATLQGETLLRMDAARALEKMEWAHKTFPSEQTAAGVQRLIEVNLTADNDTRAKELLAEVAERAKRKQEELPQLQRAANIVGDYAFGKRDFAGAAEAYDLAAAGMDPVGEDTHWAEFQRANALRHLDNIEACLALYDTIAASKSPWAKSAAAKAGLLRLEQKQRNAQSAPKPGSETG